MQSAKMIVSKTLLLGFLPILGSLSCSKLDVQEIPITANPTAEIEKLEKMQEVALSEQVNVLSPDYFKDSMEELEEAKKARSKDKDSKVILKHVARGQANLVKAEEMAKVAKAALEPVVAARAAALAADAPRLLEKDFRKVDKELISVTEDVEDNRLGPAEKRRVELLQSYSDLELAAIKEANLGEARIIVAQAEKEGAKEHASVTLKKAKDQLRDAEAGIAKNRDNKTSVELLGTQALASAKHLLNVTRQAKVMDKKDAESIVLEQEAQATKLSTATSTVLKTKKELAEAKLKTALVTGEKEQLEAIKRIDTALENAKGLFASDEADVYRDGQKLLIRLKKMAFPIGKANLTPESMPMLAMVNQTIRDLGVDSRIEVQGHTDSSGNRTTNQTLSEKRAEAIKAYLVSNGLNEKNIRTVGYGDSKPLASNKTKAGRAQNRRVDIVIEPIIPVS